MVEAVNLGGDADTTGAVTGALAGALYGEASMPRRWLDRLEPLERLERLAGALARMKPGGAP